MVLRYSVRFKRRMVTRPGSGFAGSMAKAEYLIHFSTRPTSSADGRRFPFGGIMPERSILSVLSQSSWSANSGVGSSRSKSMPPFFKSLLWQPVQNFVSTGSVDLRKLSVTFTSAALAGAAANASAVSQPAPALVPQAQFRPRSHNHLLIDTLPIWDRVYPCFIRNATTSCVGVQERRSYHG